MAETNDSLRAQILANCRVLTNPNITKDTSLEIVFLGGAGRFTAAVMIGPKPAIQGNEAPNPDAALQNLFLTTCGVLKIYVSKAGGHQRLVPDGGVYDKACIHPHLLNRKSEDDFDRRGRRCVHPSSETQRTRETDVETKVVVEH